MDGIGVAVAAKLLLVIIMRTNYKAILGIFMNQAVQWNGMGCWKPLLVADWRGSYYQISGRLSKAKKLKSRVETTCISWNFRKAEHCSNGWDRLTIVVAYAIVKIVRWEPCDPYPHSCQALAEALKVNRSVTWCFKGLVVERFGNKLQDEYPLVN